MQRRESLNAGCRIDGMQPANHQAWCCLGNDPNCDLYLLTLQVRERCDGFPEEGAGGKGREEGWVEDSSKLEPTKR